MIDVLKPLIQRFMPFAQQQMGFDRPPKLFLRQDSQNAADPMGKTGFYDPQNESITIYISGRHPKDIMRSLAHELQHHTQNCNGQFDKVTNMGEQGYAQADPHMRNMEIEAYQASIVFRDWEDSQKGTIYYEHLQKGDKSSMSTKNWKNQELNGLLMERFGFEFKPLAENLENDQHKKVVNEEGEQIFAPNHYCVHHGGVQYNGSVEMAEAVKHNYNENLGRVTHYDMKLSDGTILENVAAEDIQVTNASLAEGHGMAGKRDDEEEEMAQARKQRKEREAHQRKIRREGEDEDELEEGGRANRGENSEQGEERRMGHADRVRESVKRLHDAGYTPKQIKESLSKAFNKANKG